MEKIKEIIKSLPAFSKKERQKRKVLKDEFMHNVQTGKSMLSTERSAQLLHTLHTKIAEGILSSGQESTHGSDQERTPGISNPERKSAVLLTAAWFKWAAAAIILLIAGSFWRYYRPVKMARATAALSSVTAPSGMISKANNSDHTLALTLPDNSAVLLSPGSTIRYYPSFEPAHRNIHLSGMAVFEVAGETARPFTVYAGGINTTALGTRFMVSTLVPGKVQVRLLAGKVVVRPSDNTLALKDVYLLPGQQFLLDSRLRSFAVTEYKDSTGLAAETRKKTTTPASPQGSPINTAILEFNQEPLTGVLKKIGFQYGVTFRLNGHGFNTIQVTGKFLPSDSLQSVLSMLGSINKLSFTERNDTIVVARVQ